MVFKDWFSKKTPLQLALDRGTQPGADLEEEVQKLRDYSIKSQADAEAICRVLKQILPTTSTVGGKSALYALASLFQNLEDFECPAFAVLENEGTHLLAQIVNNTLANPRQFEDRGVLFALNTLAVYGTREGTDTVIRAAQKPLSSDSYWWSTILQAYAEEHPERERLFQALSDPLPSDFMAVSLLDSANAALRGSASFQHPFDSTEGKKQLEHWLTDEDEELYSYGVSATAALPFISAPERDALIALAFDHPSANVQLEAAWVAARLGREAGINWLARSCLDVNVAERARQYLVDLDLKQANADDKKAAIRRHPAAAVSLAPLSWVLI